MVASQQYRGLKISPRTAAAIAAGLAVAVIIAALPAGLREGLVDSTGLPMLMPMAASPLGLTATLLLATTGGALAGALSWAALYLLSDWHESRQRDAEPAHDRVPVLRRADAHPDAPPRRPILASADLGPPLPVIARAPAVSARPLPSDLDLPLAAFDPAAIPAIPRAPVRAVAPLVPRPQVIDPGERFETFALASVGDSPVPSASPPFTQPATTIAALLERLERASARTEPLHHIDSVEQALGMLRRRAAG